MPPPSEHAGHISEDDLALYLKDSLSPDLMSTIDSHLQGCEVCCDKLAEQDKCLWYLAELNVADDAPIKGEKRREPRQATDDPATLQVLAPFSNTVMDVRIVDVAAGGVKVRTPESLAPGSLVRLKMRYSVACGDVRYCLPSEQRFNAGVRLHDYYFGPLAKPARR
jgi:hypothetical protein